MYEKSVLRNNLRVLTMAMPESRSVTVSISVGAGSRYERDPEAGISHFLEHMLFKGTRNRPTAKDVSEAIEGVGGIMNAATGHEATNYWVKVARPHLALALDLLADMILYSRHEHQEMDRERLVILEELRSVKDSPDEWAFSLLDELLWPEQPLGRDIAGSAETVGGLVRGQLIRYMQRQYEPGNAVVSVAGDVTHGEVVSQVDRLFGEWQSSNPLPLEPFREVLPKSRVAVRYRKTEQAHMCLGMPGVSLQDPDRFAVGLLNAALGEGMSSRLFLELREKQGLVYDIGSSPIHLLDCGALVIFAGSDPKKAIQTLRSILGQLKLLSQDITPNELRRSKELSKGRLLLRTEDNRSMATWIGNQELLTREVLTVDDVIRNIEEVTVDDLIRVANTFFRPDLYRFSLVGPFRSPRVFLEALDEIGG